jgi:hypothetical protein
MSLFRKLVGVFQAAGLSIRKRLLGGLPALYVEDVFSTNLYTTTGSDQTITNNIDLSTYGGLVWVKGRSAVKDNVFVDTVRGVSKSLVSNTQNAEDFSSGNYVKAFSTTGFTVSGIGAVGSSGTFGTWTFRKQPKFFDIVTYTGNGNSRTIPHNLGSAPGCMIVKSISAGGTPWLVWHRSLTNPTLAYLNLESTSLRGEAATYWNSTSPTASVFSVGTSNDVNQNGTTYVAYLWAHNAGGFGLTGTDNVISCGTFNTDSGGNCAVTLDWEPQWMLYKPANNATNWQLVDNMRGITADNGANVLAPNTDAAEQNLLGYNGVFNVNSTGFTGTSNGFYASRTYIYIAIRRGPMKVPTSGTSVFSPAIWTGNDTARTITSNIVTDFAFIRGRNTGGTGSAVADRLRGANNILQFESTGSAFTDTGTIRGFDLDNGIKIGGHSSVNWNTYNFVAECFKRAPGFFDIVCYTGDGSTPGGFSHNLGVTPEMVIVKSRSSGSENWRTWVINYSFSQALSVNSTAASTSGSFGGAGLIPADSATFYVSPSATPNNMNESGTTYVAYLFATCPGVSKVGTYTGTGTTLQIDCGFTGGARFVMIKRKDSTGDWYFWDTTRGIIAGNDPYLFLNSNANEVTSTDYIDPYSPGFELSSSAPAALNASGGTFIFLAIA